MIEITCKDLADLGIWNLDYCCQLCHSDEATLSEVVDPNRVPAGVRMLLCCNAWNVTLSKSEWQELIDYKSENK